MRKPCRTRTRTRGKRVLTVKTKLVKYFAYAQLPGARWTEWSFRTVSQRQAELLVSAGEAERVTREVDGEVHVVGYHALTPTGWEKPSPCTLTLSTMHAVSEHAPGVRLSRKGIRQVEKFVVWPLIGDDKAFAVRPRISEADLIKAQAVLDRGYLAKAA